MLLYVDFPKIIIFVILLFAIRGGGLIDSMIRITTTSARDTRKQYRLKVDTGFQNFATQIIQILDSN